MRLMVDSESKIKGIKMGDEIAAGTMVSTSIKRLHDTIKEFNKQSEKYSNRMFWLTVAIFGLTLVMAVLVAVQIALMLKP
jgi:hypothetical protein